MYTFSKYNILYFKLFFMCNFAFNFYFSCYFIFYNIWMFCLYLLVSYLLISSKLLLKVTFKKYIRAFDNNT